MFIKESPRKAQNVTSGLMAGTLVETAKGWTAIEDLRIGDAVHSYDGGLARVLGLDRDWIMPQVGGHLFHLPGGALDNCDDLLLLPDQCLLIDTLNDACLPDDLVALVPATALDGVFGATRLPIEKPMEVITLRFADDEAIFANSGTLLHCPGIRQQAGPATSAFFRRLDHSEAQSFLARQYGGTVHGRLRRAA